MWETHPELKTRVEMSWKNNPRAFSVAEVQDKLCELSGDLSSWDRLTLGNVRREIKRLKHELEILRGLPGRAGPSHQEVKIVERLVKKYYGSNVRV